tara:strand:+ start:78410 stop:78727 length:318 start_codon:yes stop_codon:yes gene_type:complete
MDQSTKEAGKTMAIISYITWIGLLIAFIMNNDKQNSFAKFHIGQSIRVAILGIANYALAWVLPSSLGFITNIISLLVIVLWILGIVNAINLKETPLPVIGTIGDK